MKIDENGEIILWSAERKVLNAFVAAHPTPLTDLDLRDALDEGWVIKTYSSRRNDLHKWGVIIKRGLKRQNGEWQQAWGLTPDFIEA